MLDGPVEEYQRRPLPIVRLSGPHGAALEALAITASHPRRARAEFTHHGHRADGSSRPAPGGLKAQTERPVSATHPLCSRPRPRRTSVGVDLAVAAPLLVRERLARCDLSV